MVHMVHKVFFLFCFVYCSKNNKCINVRLFTLYKKKNCSVHYIENYRKLLQVYLNVLISFMTHQTVYYLFIYFLFFYIIKCYNLLYISDEYLI